MMATILLVDESPMALAVLTDLLQPRRLVIVTASSISAALVLARMYPIDAVLTAATLTDGTGKSLQRSFREHPSLWAVPFFFMTGSAPSPTMADGAPAFPTISTTSRLFEILRLCSRRAYDPAFTLEYPGGLRN